MFDSCRLLICAIRQVTYIIFSVGLLTTISTPSLAEDLEFERTTSVRLNAIWDIANEANQRRHAKSSRTNLTLDSEWKAFYKDFTFVFGGRVVHDFEDNFGLSFSRQEYYSDLSKPIFFDNQTMFELRNFYLEYTPETCWFGSDSCALKLGKQQIVWGQADGIKVLDIVNPQSFEYFILDDYDRSRIPLWTANIEFAFGDHEFQLLWIPDTTGHFFPHGRRAYGFRSRFFIPNIPPGPNVNFQSFTVPDFGFSDADYGFRYTTFINGWDLTINYLNKLSDFPSSFISIENPNTPDIRYNITNSLNRNKVYGGTVSNSFGDFTFRGEAAYITQREMIATAEDSDGIVEVDELAYLVGVDWYGFSNALITFQYSHNRFIGGDNLVTRGEQDEIITFAYKQPFLNDRLSIKYEHEHSLEVDDGLMRFKASYDYSDITDIAIEYNHFYGARFGLFGQYRNNDHVSLTIKFTF